MLHSFSVCTFATALGQVNYRFTWSTVYELPEASTVKLTVYTVTGQEIIALVSQEQAAGRYEAIWRGVSGNGTKVSSGVYFYRITAQPVNGGSPFSVLKKMVMLK